ncbi:MAG: hypothetical protein IJL52_07115 [Clostridia bacterium]|nr:hypothetical protein [Clostridia bacterium]
MIGGETKSFIEGLNIGKEMVVLFNGERFLVQGWWENNQAHIVVDNLDKPHQNEYLWSFYGDNMSQCADAFLEAKIWNNKVFFDVENEMRWTDDW